MPAYIFKSIELEIKVKISPKHLNDVEYGLDEYLQNFLLRYSYKMEGFVLFYNIIGFDNKFEIIGGDPSPVINCLVEFNLLNVKEGDNIEVKDGFFLGIYPAIDGEKHGELKVVQIEQRSKALPSIKVKS